MPNGWFKSAKPEGVSPDIPDYVTYFVCAQTMTERIPGLDFSFTDIC